MCDGGGIQRQKSVPFPPDAWVVWSSHHHREPQQKNVDKDNMPDPGWGMMVFHQPAFKKEGLVLIVV
jgi:hypothetical protein